MGEAVELISTASFGTKSERAEGLHPNDAFLTLLRCTGTKARRMIIHRGYRFKLYPTVEQETLFRQFSGVCRLVYNLALEQRATWGSQHRINLAIQSVEATALRNEYDWIAAVNRSCIEQALRDLDKAYGNFFAGRAAYPKPRRKGENDSFRFQGREIQVFRLNRKWSGVRLPKIGWAKFRSTRPMDGTLKNVTVAMDAFGWHVSFAREIEKAIPDNANPAVGVDRGVAATLALSTGEILSVPASLEYFERRHRAAQRVVARRKKGSRRKLKAIQRFARLSAKRARIRRDWHHKAALSIASRFGTVVMEDLKIASMTASARGTVEKPGRNIRQKAGLNRSILNQGWGSFASILGYKLEERGGTLVTVDPAYTSQTCSECGTIDRQSRESQAVFACRHCGFRANADHNAAINILRRNTASMRMEEGCWPSDEVRTGGGPTPAENLRLLKAERMLTLTGDGR